MRLFLHQILLGKGNACWEKEILAGEKEILVGGKGTFLIWVDLG